ncbi:small hydrophobic protein [Streptomyces sp. CBMA152]|uniref:small hydrophobic protein n=1 Tax=Streptomyces sp. CBMA152 TaxID=1896312 RepID=UPI001660A864|nr:small hydrophobic protein [Streptomyces sp. CBMA152]MBD0742835.1 small hydrophobic protein [Streptomyces sp. CBMA152]
MTTGLGNMRTRRSPRPRNRRWPRTGPDRATLGIIGLVCAIAGFFVLGIILGPVAVACGWLGMGRRWNGGAEPMPALVALVLGAIDTLLAFIWLVGVAAPGNGLL